MVHKKSRKINNNQMNKIVPKFCHNISKKWKIVLIRNNKLSNYLEPKETKERTVLSKYNLK
jgi:hypothetical protein